MITFFLPAFVHSFHSLFSLTISHSVGLASLKVLVLSNPSASVPSSWDYKHTLLSSRMFILLAIQFASLQNRILLGKPGKWSADSGAMRKPNACG